MDRNEVERLVSRGQDWRLDLGASLFGFNKTWAVWELESRVKLEDFPAFKCSEVFGFKSLWGRDEMGMSLCDLGDVLASDVVVVHVVAEIGGMT